MKRFSMAEDSDMSSGSKRTRKFSFSEDEGQSMEAKCKSSADSPPLSKIYNSACRNNKPAELFRKDLISAMKLPDSEQLDPDDFWDVVDSWKQEWERGVQVPVNSKNVPVPKIREMRKKSNRSNFKLPKKLIHVSQDNLFSSDIHVVTNMAAEAEKACRYDMDDLDTMWLQVFNENRADYGLPPLTEKKMELIIEDFETQCFNKFQQTLKTEKGLGIEYDENVTCDVCRLAECEEGNEMVFCDLCNICVHQACYGITAIPEGSWVCRTCALNVQPSCILCPNKGGAMKSTRTGEKWAHVSCALWIPEVAFVDAERMEPIAKVSQIPPSRWALICTFCRERVGACIQCAVKQCKVAYHVTCAFENGVDMKAFFNETKEEDGVKLRSYCLKHTTEGNEVSHTEEIVWRVKSSVKKEEKPKPESDLDAHSARIKKIREMEAVFYNYVNLEDTKDVCKVDADTVDFVFCYWKLKRTVNFNKPLLPTKMDESLLFGKLPEDSLYARMKMFVHLRQDLERVRNLCYMVTRREKLRRSFFKIKEEIFLKQVEALKDKSVKPNSKEHESIVAMSDGGSVYETVYSSKNYKIAEPKDTKDKDASEKKKLPSAARLPNPYAKRYFNGMHTRSRRQSAANSEGGKTSDSLTESKNEAELSANAPVENAALASCLMTRQKRRHSLSSPIMVKEEEKLQQTLEDMSLSESQSTEAKSSSANVSTTKAIKQEKVDNVPTTSAVEHTGARQKTTINSNSESNAPTDSKDHVPTVYNDIKNSPSQSDKENRVAHSKVKGRKSKSQMEAKNMDISKAIEELTIEEKAKDDVDSDSKIQKSEFEQQMKDDYNNFLAGGRYEMRTRHRSISVSNSDSSVQPTEKQEAKPLTSVEPKKAPKKEKTKVKEHSLELQDKEQNDEKVIKIINKKFSPGRKVTFSIKRRTRPRFFRKVKLNARETIDSSSNSDLDELPETEEKSVEDGTVFAEYKMCLRHNGKVLFSPVKKQVLGKHLDESANNSSELPRRRKTRDALSSKHDDSDSSSSDEQFEPGLIFSDNGSCSPSSSRDMTSSPRLVLKLRKDPAKQQWLKDDETSNDSTFKASRNDWDEPANRKSSQDEDELEECQLRRHRYTMRRRSKPNSTTS